MQSNYKDSQYKTTSLYLTIQMTKITQKFDDNQKEQVTDLFT